MEPSTAVTAVLVVGMTLLLRPVVGWVLQWWRTQLLLRTTTIPGPPIANPLIGHASLLLSDRIFAYLSDWANEYGPIFRLQLAHNLAVVVTDPEAIQKLLRKGSPDYLQKVPEVYATLEMGVYPRVQNILSSQDDPYWKAVRTGLAPCFSITNLKKVFPRVQQVTGEAVGIMAAAAAAGEEVDVADLAMRLTSDVMGTMLLDQDFGGMKMRPDPYLTAFRDIALEVHAHLSNPLRPYAFWSPDARAGKAALKRHDAALGQKLGEALKSPPADHTIAGHLFKVTDPTTGQPLSLTHLKADLGIVLGAGFETTSHAITWLFALLATHLAVQDKLLQELLAAGLGQREFEWGDLGRLPYLTAVIKEALRLFSPTSLGTARLTAREMTICGHQVPRGTWVFIAQGPIGTTSYNYGPTAGLFNPERWLQYPADSDPAAALGPEGLAAGAAGAPDAAPAAGAAAAGPPDPLSFSYGPRDCIGQTLARMELQVVVASFLVKFKLTPGTSLAQAVEAAQQAAAAGKAKGPQKLVAGLSPEQRQLAAVVQGIYDTAQYHITLQPKDGMLLVATPRG